DADFDTHFEKERQEWDQARKSGDQTAMQDEFGDYLFCVVEMGRRCGIKANAALHEANAKFLRRFTAMEKLAASQGRDFAELDLKQMNSLWEQVKAAEKE
ncbi:MAG: nucleoside triphosphate pyrophosphohydrolase, partial [Deltaproteobacteria bacterium]